MNVELLRRYLQTPSDLLQDVGTGLAQPALDLRQIRIGHAGDLGQLAQRDLRDFPLFADEGADAGSASALLARAVDIHLSSVRRAR